MKQFRSFILIVISVLSAHILHAQDLMHLRSQKQPIKVKVIELGVDEIKYKSWPVTEDAPMLVIDKSNVAKIVLQNGDVYTFSANPMNNAFNYVGQANCAVKFSFFSPLFNHLGFSFEKSVKPGQSFEAGLGIVGVGNEDVEFKANPQGVYLRGGYKFITSPDFYTRGMKYAHLLKGSYIKPELVFGMYALSRPDPSTMNPDDTYRRQVTTGGVFINFGKQWVAADVMCFDLYWGIGYAFANYEVKKRQYSNGTLFAEDYETESYHYAYLGGWSKFPIAFTAGFKVGFLFNKSKAKDIMPSEDSVQ